jgi:hypothetical protein
MANVTFDTPTVEIHPAAALQLDWDAAHEKVGAD